MLVDFVRTGRAVHGCLEKGKDGLRVGGREGDDGWDMALFTPEISSVAETSLAGDPGDLSSLGTFITSTAKDVKNPDVVLPLHIHHDHEMKKAVGRGFLGVNGRDNRKDRSQDDKSGVDVLDSVWRCLLGASAVAAA